MKRRPFERILSHLALATGGMNVLKSVMQDTEMVVRISLLTEKTSNFIENYPVDSKYKQSISKIINERFDQWKPSLHSLKVRIIDVAAIICASFETLLEEVPPGSYSYRKLSPIYEEFFKIMFDMQPNFNPVGFFSNAVLIVSSFTEAVPVDGVIQPVDLSSLSTINIEEVIEHGK